MDWPLDRLRGLFSELRRRNVYRVLAAYLVAGFVVLQLADLAAGAFDLPAWFPPMIWVLVGLGLPVAIVLAWAFELTPEGVRRTPAVGPRGGVRDRGRGPGGEARSGSGLPGAALAVLALAVLAIGAWWMAPVGDDPAVTDRSVAVLPFENMGGEKSDQFTRGIHDGLLTRLSNVSDLRVISRTSVMQYEETDRTVPEIARELGAAWVVEGAVQRAGGQVQVNAQLIRAREDAHRWARAYRRELTPENLFAIQGELTKEIAGSLEAEISPAERERVEREPTADLEAYRLYVEGRTYLDRRTEEDMRRALGLFRRALARDSSYAPAWTGLADARILLTSYGHASPDTMHPRAQSAVRRALELDPELAEAHATTGLLRQDLRQDGPGAVRALRRAVELRPSYARAHHWLAILLVLVDRPGEALTAAERAVELDPLSPAIRTALAGAYFHDGRFGEALVHARRGRELGPGYPVASLALGRALLGVGRPGEAIEVIRRALERTDPGPRWAAMGRATLAVGLHRTGEEARSRAVLQRIEDDGASLAAAVVHAALDRPEAALSALERADLGFYYHVTTLRTEPLLDPLRDDPRFRAVVRRVNTAWGLEPDGSFPPEEASAPGPGIRAG